MGGGTLLDRRHPPVPPVLAFQQFARTVARRVSQPLRSLRPHDGAPRRAANFGNRGIDRLRTSCVTGRQKTAPSVASRSQLSYRTGRTTNEGGGLRISTACD